jgi:hypothetical protein
MDDMSFDAFTRDAAAVSRRTSLGVLGAAGLTAVTAWVWAAPASARDKGKKKRRRGKNISRQANLKCTKQKAECLDFLKERCDGDEDCAVSALRCCPLASECDVIGFFLCLGE